MFYRIVRFLFFKQKTAYEMRISDWSSDVCSSDLVSSRRPWPRRTRLRCAFRRRGRRPVRTSVPHGRGRRRCRPPLTEKPLTDSRGVPNIAKRSTGSEARTEAGAVRSPWQIPVPAFPASAAQTCSYGFGANGHDGRTVERESVG